jgi:cell division protein FtsQ
MWDDARQLHAIAVTLSAIALAFLAFAIAGYVARLPAFAYREVIVTTPLVRASPAHVESIVRSELRGTFFTMDLDAARAALARVPWVRAVALRRQWPRRLEIELSEHEPFARWNDGALVDTQGDVFVADYAGELPQFDGPDGQAALMSTRYLQWNADLAP